MTGPDADGGTEVRAIVYLPAAEDLEASCARLAGHPVAFRVLMTALRAGCASVAVPAVLRGTAVERAIDAHPGARAATVWISSPATLAAPGPTLLVPSTSVLPVKSLRMLRESAPIAVLSGSSADAPVALVDHCVVESYAKDLAAGHPMGLSLQVALGQGAALSVSPGSWSVRATSESSRHQAERRLLADLGSAIDSWLDTVVHRRLSRLLTPAMVGLGVSPNAISMLSVAIGLVAALGWASATLGGATLGLALYFVSVVLDHSDGEVARLTFAESRLGEWLDTLGDTIVHVGGALAMGIAAQRLEGSGLLYGGLAALGFAASALVSKALPPPPAGDSIARTVSALGTRDGFYVLLVLFLLTLGLAPAALPHLVLVAALGSHLYWLSALIARARTAPPAAQKVRPEVDTIGGSPQRAKR
jgi:phosphatidylglycerophosphate synthase